MPTKEKRILHIYPQTEHHTYVGIVGTREALKGLRKLIDLALSDGTRWETHFDTVSDEGFELRQYEVFAKVLSEQEMSKRKLPHMMLGLLKVNDEK